MSIIESVPSTKISIETDFTKPFVAHNLNEFVLEPAGSATRVTWTLPGTNLYLMKIMGTFVNMDRMMGKHFETGLNNLKTMGVGSKDSRNSILSTNPSNFVGTKMCLWRNAQSELAQAA